METTVLTYSVVVVVVVGPGSLPGNGFSQSPPGLETHIEYPIDARRDSLSQYVPISGFQLISWDHVALYVLEIEEQVSDSATLCVSHLILLGMQRDPEVGNWPQLTLFLARSLDVLTLLLSATERHVSPDSIVYLEPSQLGMAG